MSKFINLEYHPMDSRIRIADDDVCQTLSERMGTGGGNVPIVLLLPDLNLSKAQQAEASDTRKKFRQHSPVHH